MPERNSVFLDVFAAEPDLRRGCKRMAAAYPSPWPTPWRALCLAARMFRRHTFPGSVKPDIEHEWCMVMARSRTDPGSHRTIRRSITPGAWVECLLGWRQWRRCRVLRIVVQDLDVACPDVQSWILWPRYDALCDARARRLHARLRKLSPPGSVEFAQSIAVSIAEQEGKIMEWHKCGARWATRDPTDQDSSPTHWAYLRGRLICMGDLDLSLDQLDNELTLRAIVGRKLPGHPPGGTVPF